jgi:hypothetical protein
VFLAERLLQKGQDFGGWNGGVELMLERVVEAVIGDWLFRADMVAGVSGRLTTASGLGAQASDCEQSAAGEGDWAVLVSGMDR